MSTSRLKVNGIVFRTFRTMALIQTEGSDKAPCRILQVGMMLHSFPGNSTAPQYTWMFFLMHLQCKEGMVVHLHEFERVKTEVLCVLFHYEEQN